MHFICHCTVPETELPQICASASHQRSKANRLLAPPKRHVEVKTRDERKGEKIVRKLHQVNTLSNNINTIM